MIISWIIGLLIFGYAGFVMFRFVKNSKKGKCATCELKKACSQESCSSTFISVESIKQQSTTSK